MRTLQILLFVCISLLIAACSQATSPSSTGQALANQAGSGTGGGVTPPAGTLIDVQISSGTALQGKFPNLGRLQLTITGPAGTPGIPVQLNIPINNIPQNLKLPTGIPLNFAFDAFDNAGNYLGAGSSQSTLQANVNPVIPVNLAPVAAGTPYINPLAAIINPNSPNVGTGNTGNTNTLSLTVSVQNGPSEQAVPNASVIISNGLTSAISDQNGIANFTALSLPQDIHIFSGTQAISIIANTSNTLQILMDEFNPVSASVNVNAPTGPLLAATWLLDLYFTDGINIQAIGGINGDKTALRTAKLSPMRGPIGLTAMAENTADNTPKADNGTLYSVVNTGHSSLNPINATIPDPVLEPRVTPLANFVTIPTLPSGLSSFQNVQVDTFAALPANTYVLVSHKDGQLLNNNQRNISIWPERNANTYIRRIEITDPYSAKSTAWQRQVAPLGATPFPSLPTFYGVPIITQASLNTVTWTDWTSSPVWSGYMVEFKQGLDKSWKIYNFVAGQSLTLPNTLSNLSPLIKGIPATVVVHQFLLDPTAGFNLAQPDLWYLDRYLSHKVSSKPFSFIP